MKRQRGKGVIAVSQNGGVAKILKFVKNLSLGEVFEAEVFEGKAFLCLRKVLRGKVDSSE